MSNRVATFEGRYRGGLSMELPSMVQVWQVDIPHEIDITCSMMNKILYHELQRNYRKQILMRQYVSHFIAL